jgi:hypothetical protein
MKLPLFRRLFKTDFKQEFQELVDQLSVSINVGIENLYDALNRKLSLRDNILCTVKELEITVSPTGIPITTSIIQLDISGRVDGVIVISAVNITDSSVYPSSGVFVSWTQNQNGILINHITGLPANQKFRVKMVAFGQ